MPTVALLERARVLLRRHGAKAAALGIMPLAAVVSDARGAVILDGYQVDSEQITWSSGGSFPGGLTVSIDTEVTNAGQVVKMFGEFGTITGQDWDAFSVGSLIFRWSGQYVGTLEAGDRLVAVEDFTVVVNGGVVDWAFNFTQSNVITQNPFVQQVRSVSDSGNVLGGPPADTPALPVLRSLEGDPWTMTGSGGPFSASLSFNWSGFSPADTLRIIVPQSSVDVGINFIPEPATAAFLGLGAAVLVLRRGRREA